MTRLLRWVAASLAVAWALAPAWAFSPATRVEIAGRATTLMPPALRRQLERHRDLLLAEALEPLRQGEGAGDHVLNPDDGGAADALAAAVDDAVRALDRQRPFGEVVRAYGRLAHITADLCYPPNSDDHDPREPSYYYEFASYVESRLERIPLVWLGWQNADLARDDIRGFARGAAERARRDYATVARSYFPEGRERLPQDFDDRSPAFAAASLSYSHAVGETARLWLYVWKRAHGDRRGTPYLEPGADPFVPSTDESGSTSP